MSRAILFLALLLAGAVAAVKEVRRVETKAQLREILEDKQPWLIYYHDGQEIVLPSGETDTREAAWFAKLAAIWERDVRHGVVPWARDSMSPMFFASADRTKLVQDGASELFDSEFADLPIGARLYLQGGDRGPVPREMVSRRDMQAVLKHCDVEIAESLGIQPDKWKDEL